MRVAPDGTIDLKTGEKIASRPEDYSTRCTSVGMGSNPRPAKWLKYLKETFGGNQVVIDFMQRVCGCALTGVTWDHPLFFFYGPGGTGKNTFTYALSGIPGARAGTVDKFQGQEAAVVIYAMTTSSPEEAPRGMEFLYNLNRFNVATSRARCAMESARRRFARYCCRRPSMPACRPE